MAEDKENEAPLDLVSPRIRAVQASERGPSAVDVGHENLRLIVAAKEKELDLPPLPDIPDDVPPDTDDV